MIGGCVLCLADWVLIEDFGFLGGVGTDPNSMIPMALVFIAGYLAITRRAGPRRRRRRVPGAQPVAGSPWRERLRASPTYVFRSLAAFAALAITLVGAIPMAVAATEPNAAPILAEAIDGTPNAVSLPAKPFTLVDQHDQPVSLASLRGRTIALTFLDDVCTSDCPIIAQEFRLADGMLGADARRVEMVAVNANPLYVTPDYLSAFDHQENLDSISNWLYLTGSLTQLERVWAAYGATVQILARRRDDRPQRLRRRDRRKRADPLRLGLRSGAGDRSDEVLLRGHARKRSQEHDPLFVIARAVLRRRLWRGWPS